MAPWADGSDNSHMPLYDAMYVSLQTDSLLIHDLLVQYCSVSILTLTVTVCTIHLIFVNNDILGTMYTDSLWNRYPTR